MKELYSDDSGGNMQTLQFPPEFDSINKLLHHNIIQTLIVLGNVVDIAIVTDEFEVATGTLNLASSEMRALEVIAFLKANAANYIAAFARYIDFIIFSMDSIPSSVRLYFIFNTCHYRACR